MNETKYLFVILLMFFCSCSVLFKREQKSILKGYKSYHSSVDSLKNIVQTPIIIYISFIPSRGYDRYILWKESNDLKIIKYDRYGAYVPRLSNDSVSLYNYFIETYSHYELIMNKCNCSDTTFYNENMNDYYIDPPYLPHKSFQVYENNKHLLYLNINSIQSWILLMQESLSEFEKTGKWYVLDIESNEFEIQEEW